MAVDLFRKLTIMKRLSALLGTAALVATNAFAIPTLQLGIDDGTYVGGADETTYATTNPFTLHAYLSNSTYVSDTFYLSYALVKTDGTDVTQSNPSLGSITIGGVVVNVTGDMVWGVPPIDTFNQLFDAGDLPTHGIFPTYFNEVSFSFLGSPQVAAFNVEDGSSGPGTMYDFSWLIDVTNLADGYAIHFDLYNVTQVEACLQRVRGDCVLATVDYDTGINAPFSHDAQSGGDDDGGDDDETIPEPGTVALLGIGLAGLAASRRKRVA